MRGLDVGDPVADRLTRRFLERLRSELDGTHLRAEQAHPLDVGPLPPHVLGAHVHDALEAEAGADRRRGHAVLPCTCLGNDPALAETLRQDGLAERVVELVRSSVQQVLPLQVDPLARSEALRERERRRSPRVVAPEPVELGCERRVPLGLGPTGLELVERRDQRLRHVLPP